MIMLREGKVDGREAQAYGQDHRDNAAPECYVGAALHFEDNLSRGFERPMRVGRKAHCHGNPRDRTEHCEQDQPGGIYRCLLSAMLESNWLHRIAIGGLVVALLWHPLAVVGQQQPEPPKTATTTEAQQQPPPVTDSALRRMFDDAIKIFAEEKATNAPSEDRKERREISDLFAQWQQSRWAKYSAIFAGIGLFANAAAIALVWLTFRETRRTANAAVDQAVAANAANIHAQETTQRELRAYVFVKELILAVDKMPSRVSPYTAAFVEGASNTYRIRAELENSGNTPAGRVTYCINSESSESELTADFDFPDSKDLETTVIGPRAVAHTQTVSFPAIEITMASRDGWHLYIWGWIEYSDIFPDTPRHRTEYCFEVVAKKWPDGDKIDISFRPHNRFNGADKDCMRKPQT
jgi:hypothetical protein